MNIFRTGWYLIYTMPRYERKVFQRLNELNIKAFLPLTKKLRIWHDRKKFVDEPLFPSYVFIYLQDVSNYYRGEEVRGVLNYVRVGRELAKVKDSIIDNIRIAANECNAVEISNQEFLPGQQLVIRDGALTGLACEVVRVNNEHKLLVRVDLLKRNILINLTKDQLMTQ